MPERFHTLHAVPQHRLVLNECRCIERLVFLHAAREQVDHFARAEHEHRGGGRNEVALLHELVRLRQPLVRGRQIARFLVEPAP